MQRTDILRLVGNTPLVEIRRLNPHPNVKIMAKIESMNPGGSIKDRVAVAMIEVAEKSGLLTPGKTIIEATSGNTGVGLAMVAAVKGYKMLLLMPETASEERKRIMRGYGASIRLTPGRMGTDGAIEEAYRLARTEPDKYVLMDQFNNPASIEAHYNGTGLEIWEQTGGAVTHAVATLGTSGTAMGLAKRLHEYPGVKVVAVEPFAGHKIQGLKNMHESYPPGIYNKKALDQILHVEDEEAFSMCRKLAQQEGLFVGMSSGAAMAGALKLAASIEAEGQKGYVVVIFPDSGERYLSTPLFAPKALDGLRLMNLATGAKAVVDATGSLNIYTIGPSLDSPMTRTPGGGWCSPTCWPATSPGAGRRSRSPWAWPTWTTARSLPRARRTCPARTTWPGCSRASKSGPRPCVSCRRPSSSPPRPRCRRRWTSAASCWARARPTRSCVACTSTCAATSATATCT